MELKLNIGYQELFELICQLPSNQIKRLRKDLDKIQIKPPSGMDSFKDLLLAGPVMSEEQFDAFEENRRHFNEWNLD